MGATVPPRALAPVVRAPVPAALRRSRTLPSGLPVTVIAADDPRRAAPRRERWLARRRALAAVLGGAFRPGAPAGHLLVLDRPGDVAGPVLHARVRPPLPEGRRAHGR
ncbi:hypothetical protein ACH4VM_00875 [Streptomyces sp. NPDC020792]|uniref:hypothetical protein n=1 Tax=Streptomyces sp. NPDC020792 TaxID=3365089 RepID=UPI00379DB92F